MTDKSEELSTELSQLLQNNDTLTHLIATLRKEYPGKLAIRVDDVKVNSDENVELIYNLMKWIRNNETLGHCLDICTGKKSYWTNDDPPANVRPYSWYKQLMASDRTNGYIHLKEIVAWLMKFEKTQHDMSLMAIHHDIQQGNYANSVMQYHKFEMWLKFDNLKYLYCAQALDEIFPEKRQMDDAKKIEDDRKKVVEDQRKADAERLKVEEERIRTMAEKKKVEEERIRSEAEKKRIEEEKAKVEVEKRRVEDEKVKAELTKKKAEEDLKKAGDALKEAQNPAPPAYHDPNALPPQYDGPNNDHAIHDILPPYVAPPPAIEQNVQIPAGPAMVDEAKPHPMPVEKMAEVVAKKCLVRNCKSGKNAQIACVPCKCVFICDDCGEDITNGKKFISTCLVDPKHARVEYVCSMHLLQELGF